MTIEEILQELRNDPDFAALPAEWQSQIANEAMNGGIGAASKWGAGTGAQSLTIQNIPQLAPQLMAEWNRVRANGDRRSWEQWAGDHLRNTDPNWLNSVQHLAPAGTPGVSGSDEQNAALARWRQKAQQNSTSETVPLEQDLMDRVLRDYVYPDLERDTARRTQAQGYLDNFNRGLDQAVAQAQPFLDGRRLAEENAMADDTGRRLRDAVNAEATGQLGALDTLQTGRLDALAPLEKERLTLADTQVSGINQALEGERDRQTAENMMKGYVGSSSAEDAAMLRATLDARQGAAETMGGAKVANATDRRGIFDDTARGKASTEYSRLAGVRGADENVAGFRKEYFDNDAGRRLDLAFRLPSLETQRLTMMGAADAIGQSGLDRSLQTLNWFAGQPYQPNYQTFQTTASQVGRDIAGLGAGVTGAAINIGNANKWWQTPKTTTPTNPSAATANSLF